VMAAIGPFLAENIRKKYETQTEAKTEDIVNTINIPIEPVVKKIIEEHPDWYKAANPGYRGHNPTHPDSKSRMDLAIDTKKNWWICGRCAPNGYGFGNTLYFIALVEGVLQCHECKKGGLRGDKFLQVKKLAIEKYGIDEKLFPKDMTAGPSFDVPVNGGRATVVLYGRNSFGIRNGDKAIYPKTKAGEVIWYESEFYRGKIAKRLMAEYGLKKDDAESKIMKICDGVQKLVQKRRQEGRDMELSEELQEIIDGITAVNVVRSKDCNIYEICIAGEEIVLTDIQLYEGGKTFAVQYLNRFLKRIDIPQEAWDNFFIPAVLSKDKLHQVETKPPTVADTVIEKFIMYIKTRQVFDWADTAKRVGQKNALFYDKETNVVRISCDFIGNFFEREKITQMYKMTTQMFSSVLHNEEHDFMVRERMSGKVGKTVETFWVFKPEKLGVKLDDIAITEPNVVVAHMPDLSKFNKESDKEEKNGHTK